MCGIAGIVSKNEDETAANLKRMLYSMQHRGPDGAGMMIGKNVEHKSRLEALIFENKKGMIALGHVRLAITGGMDGLQPFQSKDKRFCILHNGEIYNYRELRKELKDVHFQTKTDSEVVLHLIEKNYNGDLTEAMQKVLPKLDGVYALVVTDNRQTIIARDKIGVRQLYYLKNRNHVAFASEKKPLFAVSNNGSEVHRLLPGDLTIINHGQNMERMPFWTLDDLKISPKIKDEAEAIETYSRVIQEAVRKRVAGRKRVGIIFSGGIDSLLIAHEVQSLGIAFTCYTAGRQGAIDIEWAQRLARQFDFPLKVALLTTDDIEELIPQIVRDIEDYSLNQVEVSVPIYASVRMAQEAGERVILTGQGADELFGGYPWYSKIVDQEGYESFERYSWEDTFLLYKECLEREDKIAMAHSMELRVPFLDPKVIQTAFQIFPDLKIEGENDNLAKRIHRKYCVSRGIPIEIAFRKKEAAQHGADVHDVFEELALSHGLTESLLNEVGYDPGKTVLEKLGSSSRYGFKYGDHHLWKPLPHVQYYLDSKAAELGLLPEKARYHWQEINQKLHALKCAAQKEES
ncbi:MAG: asparagine synthase (glutamine-hydrolyzing) [bacterium]